MTNLLRKTLFLCFIAYLMPAAVVAQEFIEGVYLYNRAQYDSLVSYFVPQFLRNHSTESGLAHYFLAESHYNIALSGSGEEAVKASFEAAWRAFKLASRDSELKSTFPEYYHTASYKLGWCSFRLAELSGEPLAMYQQAYREFKNTQAGAPDSLKVFSMYMAAESKLREAEEAMFAFLDSGNQLQTVQDVLSMNGIVTELYSRILLVKVSRTTPVNLMNLQEYVRFKKMVADMSFAAFFQALSTETWGTGIPGEKREAYRRRALDLVAAGIGVDSIEGEPNGPASAAPYFNLMGSLYRHYFARQSDTREAFLQQWRKKAMSELRSELLLRRANVSHASYEAEGDEFHEFANTYYDSARGIAESVYWLGQIEMIQGAKKRSRQHLGRFLSEYSADRKVTPRERTLIEDATYRQMLLDFENFYLNRSTGRLRGLAAELANFVPHNHLIAKRKVQLDLLVNCSLARDGNQIWTQILKGSDEKKLEQAFATIGFILPRAALNIGLVRERYLQLLERLFDITRSRRKDETTFFEGIVKSLEAEIEATPMDKAVAFAKAAEAMSAVRANFRNRNEADYIRARCLFFADDFENAKAILVRLINEHQYLRASFYLAEIFRLDGHGQAARRCYENIITKLQAAGHGRDDFWLSNAIAGFESADDGGTLAPLDSIYIEEVVFQPTQNPELLTYEKLAEEKFLKQKEVQESLHWLIVYGLPVRDFYPSHSRLAANLVAERNLFNSFPGVINEVRGPITSSLILEVLTPRNVQRNLEVVLGDEQLQESDGGVYVRRFIPLKAKLELQINNVDCYEFRQRCQFTQPGEDRRVVTLNRRLSFVETNRNADLFKDFDYSLKHRWDENYVFKILPDLPPDCDLRQDYDRKIELRDIAVHASQSRLLAVNSKAGEIWTYSVDGKRLGTLKLAPQVELKSPEGVAVGSNGEIVISDWATHRILRFQMDGGYLGAVGSFGVNTEEDIGHPVKFVFPTRLAIIETERADQPHTDFTQDYLYVADYNGVHICKLDGAFLGTLIPQNEDFERGSFYGFLPKGFGVDAKLFLVKRLSSKAGQVFEFQSE